MIKITLSMAYGKYSFLCGMTRHKNRYLKYTAFQIIFWYAGYQKWNVLHNKHMNISWIGVWKCVLSIFFSDAVTFGGSSNDEADTNTLVAISKYYGSLPVFPACFVWSATVQVPTNSVQAPPVHMYFYSLLEIKILQPISLRKFHVKFHVC